MNARDQFAGAWAAMVWNAVGVSGKGARRPSMSEGAHRGAQIGCRGKKHSAPAKLKRRAGLKGLASYATQYTHLLTPLITERLDRKGT